ncbi:MAG: serine/threonine-protein phosphatase [Planctomycetes bacterium]|nr:serine/threonine-protein phosphatase [Planctomycetota bacterium]
MKVPAGLRVGVCSHTGLVRGANEDDYLLATPPRVAGAAFVAAVADGMGGAAGGAEASRTALRALAATLLDDGGDGDGSGDGRRDGGVDDRMMAGFQQANARVFEAAAAVPALRDMGTTLTALWLGDGQGVLGHIGDSRLYRVRGDTCEVVTEDHAVKSGESLLTRCIGGGQLECEPEHGRFKVVAGDRFVLCTDGVWNVVAPELFAATAAERDPQLAAERLVRRALDQGGPDNATAVVLDVIDPRLADNEDVELPRHERPDARSLWPEAGSLRPPVWPWLLLLLALLVLTWSALRWFGVDLFEALSR